MSCIKRSWTWNGPGPGDCREHKEGKWGCHPGIQWQTLNQNQLSNKPPRPHFQPWHKALDTWKTHPSHTVWWVMVTVLLSKLRECLIHICINGWLADEHHHIQLSGGRKSLEPMFHNNGLNSENCGSDAAWHPKLISFTILYHFPRWINAAPTFRTQRPRLHRFWPARQCLLLWWLCCQRQSRPRPPSRRLSSALRGRPSWEERSSYNKKW